MFNLAIAFCAIIIGLVWVYVTVKKEKWKDIVVEAPPNPRTDVLYGYYASVKKEDYYNTKDHTSMFWFSGFFGVNEDMTLSEDVISIFKETDHKIVLELTPWITEWTTYDLSGKNRKMVLNKNAQTYLMRLFHQLHTEGVLSKIRYIAINDEPQLFIESKQEHLKMIKLVKQIVSQFPVKDVKWLNIFLAGEEFWNIEEFDIVGVDAYNQKSMVLTKGEHARLLKEKLPRQTTMIIPGSAYKQDPTPFINWAQTHGDVEMVVNFLWFSNSAHQTDGKGKLKMLGLEGQSQEFRDLWISEAKRLLNI